MMDKQVRQSIEALFEQYRLFKYIIETTSHKQQEPSYVEFIDRIETVVAKLPEREKEMIRLRHLHPEGDYTTDQEIYRQLGISPMTYSKLRSRAFNRLHLVLEGFPIVSGKGETNAENAQGGR